MKAVKGNKVYTIEEAEKKTYLAQGYDITDDAYQVIEHSPAATVPYHEYEKLLNENKALRQQLEDMTSSKKK